jgi:rhodanese-related sulfurtransferase
VSGFSWSRDISRAALVVVFWLVVALAVNAASPRQIAWVGAWPSTYGADTAAVPPSYVEGDPPILRLDQAIAKFQSAEVVFIDAREPADFAYGHIERAVNLPFDYYDDYADSVLPGIPTTADIVTYCGGEDCELSLYLARQLVTAGYSRVSIFFGGFGAWEEAGMPLANAEP